MMKFYLAPMEGLTGYVFRNAHRECFGEMDRYFTPFLASKKFSSKEKKEVLPENNSGIDVVPQILTNKAEEFIFIVRQLEQRGYTEVNLNLGCPSGTVTAKNRGAGFLKVQDELRSFLEKIYDGSPLPISIKTRIGAYNPEEFQDLIELYNDFPLTELIIHPRLMTDFYKGSPRLENFSEAVAKSVHSLCYNGDINSVSDYQKIVEMFPTVNKVMLGRGLLANPGLVNEIKGSEAITTSVLRGFHSKLFEGYKESIGDERNTLFKMKELWVFMRGFFKDCDRELQNIRKADNYMEYEIAVRALMERNICYTKS